VSPTKGTARSEVLRFAAFARDYPALAGKVISEVTPADIAGWRDAYLKRVSASSVKRVGNSLRAVFTIAAKEWGWCGDSPFMSIKMPADNAPRDRVASWREIRRICRRCTYVTGHPPVSPLQTVAWAFLVALRTGMRQAEIVRLQVGDVQGSVASIQNHKTKHLTGKPRRVPLTPQGSRLLAQLVAYAQARGRVELFGMRESVLSSWFRKITASLMIDNLHFHDARATALTHLARRLDLMELARVSGHANIKILYTVYYRDTAEDIAARLRRPALNVRRSP
jgi:integrase